jgi:serine/threonine protein kinase
MVCDEHDEEECRRELIACNISRCEDDDDHELTPSRGTEVGWVRSLSQMPDDLLLEILTSLKVKEVLLAGTVSQRWARLASEKSLWLRLRSHANDLIMYRKLQSLGEGRYCSVSQYRDRATGEMLAVKKWKVRPDVGVSPNIVREASVLRLVDHPNVARLKHVTHASSDVLMFFEYLEGGINLHQVLHDSCCATGPSVAAEKLKLKIDQPSSDKKMRSWINQPSSAFKRLQQENIHPNKSFSPSTSPLQKTLQKFASGLEPVTVQHVMYQLLSGVAALHSLSIVHRNLKPSKILFDPTNGCIKITSFTSARTCLREDRLYSKQVVTLVYRAPEILLGSAQYEKPVDIWSAACIFAEMVTGQVLFDGDSEIDVMYRIFRLVGTPNDQSWPAVANMPEYQLRFPKWDGRPLDELVPGLGQAGVDLLKKMLVCDPQQRVSALEALEHPYFDSIRQAAPASPIGAKRQQMLRMQEANMQLNGSYIKHVQTDISAAMREILIDWIFELRQEISLQPRTMHMAVYIIDSYLSKQPTTRMTLQLLGTCAVALAAKHEEVELYSLADYAYFTDKTYTVEELSKMEELVLNTINFSLVAPTRQDFLLEYLELLPHGACLKTALLAQYLTDLSLLEYDLLMFAPSEIAASALALALITAYPTRPWMLLQQHCSSLIPCLARLYVLHLQAECSQLEAIRRMGQYSSSLSHLQARAGSFLADEYCQPSIVHNTIGYSPVDSRAALLNLVLAVGSPS